MSTTITFQELEFLKEENKKLKENFTNFLKTNKTNKRIKEFMSEQELLLNNVNEKIESIIAKTDDKIGSEDSTNLKDESVSTILENFMRNPGLQHLAENILLNLNYQSLENCTKVNETFQQFLDDPMFWLKRFIQRGLSKKNQDDWIEAIQMTRDGRVEADLKKNILLYLKRYSQNERVVDFDVPCFLNDQAFLQKAPEVIKSFTCDCVERMHNFLFRKPFSYFSNCDCSYDYKRDCRSRNNNIFLSLFHRFCITKKMD